MGDFKTCSAANAGSELSSLSVEDVTAQGYDVKDKDGDGKISAGDTVTLRQTPDACSNHDIAATVEARDVQYMNEFFQKNFGKNAPVGGSSQATQYQFWKPN